MTTLILLDRLADFTRDAVKDLLLPVRQQENDAEALAMRAAEVYKMRLPDSGSAKKKAPYIIHQVVTTNDLQPVGEQIHATAKLRTVFCVYSPDEEEGSLMLLNLMERLRIALLKQVVIGHQFTLDTTAGLERLMYLDDTAPESGEIVFQHDASQESETFDFWFITVQIRLNDAGEIAYMEYVYVPWA